MNVEVRARLTKWYMRYERWEGRDPVLRRSPAQTWFRRRAVNRLAVLGYHAIEDSEAFAAQLDRLLETSVPVSLQQVEEAVYGGRPLPPYSVLVTFDDGDLSVHTHARPLMAARNIPGVCFVIAGLVDTDTAFWWDEIEHLVRHGGTTGRVPAAPPEITAHTVKTLPEHERRQALEELRETASVPAPRRRQLTGEELRELEADQIVVGSHTLTHPCLDQCDDGQVRTEVLQAHEQLTGLLGHPPTTFAYPNGNFDSRAHRFLMGAGYRSGFLYDHRLAAPGAQHPLRISRLRVSTRTGPDRFDTILSGLHSALYRAERGTGRGLAHAAQLVRATPGR
ncbi:polysaccharide deacetylase family protein [Streptomyces sp. NPDC002671]